MASIRRHPESPDRWQVRYRDPTGRQRTKVFARKSDAERYRAIVEADKLRGDWADPRLARTLFGDWWQQHLATKLHLKDSTRARNDSIGRNMILPTFESMQLGAIRPAVIRHWVSKLMNHGYAAATIRKAFQLLSAALDAAVDEGLIPRSPTRKITLPSERKPPMRFLAADEVAILANTIEPRYRVLAITAAYTGLRFGELAALRVEDIDFLRKRLRVERTLSEVRGHLSFTDTKTRASRRTVQLPSFLVELLAAHVAEYSDPSGLVFTSPLGGPLRRTHFRSRHWLPAVRDSIGEPCRFHDLRHTHAALLIAQGEHPKVIQGRLGHASISTTLDTYGHLFDGLDEAAADRLDQLFAGTGVDKSWTRAGA